MGQKAKVQIYQKTMLDKPEASTTIGLELEENLVKGIQLSYVKGKPKFDKLFEVTIDSVHGSSLYMDNAGQDFQKRLQKALILTSLHTREVLIRQLEIKLKKDKDIEEVLLFQMEPLLPYPSENAILDYTKIRSTEDGTLLTVLAARKDHLQHHLEQWAKVKIEPEIITAVPAALATFAKTCVPSEQAYCMIHLGFEYTTCLLIENGKLIAAQSIPHGIHSLKQVLASETDISTNLGDIDISQLSEKTNPALYKAWEALGLEIKRVIFSISKQSQEQPIRELLITGTGALIPHMASTLAQDLEMQQIFPRQELFPHLTMGQIQNFAVPLGAALSGLPSTKDKINFRQEDFSYPHPWKRIKNSLLLYGGLCLALALAFYLFGQSYLSYRQDQIRESYIQLLTVMNKPYDSFEKEFEAKNFSAKSSSEEVKDIKKLNETDLANRIQYLDKEIQSTPDIFPLLPNVPKVSDVLAWLSNLQVQLAKKSPQGKSQPIQIENFNYTLVKRPEQTKKQEKYQVKVEFEFTSPTPKQAREFHDALIEPNDFVDPKGEVKWNSSHGRYRTSFYLKPNLPPLNGSYSNSFPLEARKNKGAIFSNMAPLFSEPLVRASREKITSNMTAFKSGKLGLKDKTVYTTL